MGRERPNERPRLRIEIRLAAVTSTGDREGPGLVEDDRVDPAEVQRDGRVLSRWSETDGDARRAMATGADGAADALIARYAKATAPAEPVTQRMVFTGLRGGGDYLRLSAALQRMSVVRAIRPQRAAGDRLEVELDLLTGMAGFRRMVDESVLMEVEGGDELAAPVYLLR